jgi:hypothetical protein
LARLSKVGGLRILDFDVEARPLSWIGGDYVSRELTAIAASFVGEKKIHTWILGRPADEFADQLDPRGFVELYNRADIVTGHYIRKYDLPNLNGALMELGLEPLAPKLASDTKTDLLSRDGISASQESLSDMLGVQAPKFHMTNPMWREANRLTPAGIALTRKRVTMDIVQHKELRLKLIDAGWLAGPSLWIP